MSDANYANNTLADDAVPMIKGIIDRFVREGARFEVRGIVFKPEDTGTLSTIMSDDRGA